MAEKSELAGTIDETRSLGRSSFPVQFAQLRRQFEGLPERQRRWLIFSLAFVTVLGILALWFFQRPDWRPLFNGLDQKDIQQVSQELAAGGIPFQVTSDGTSIEVPSDMLDKARMEVAAKGMPQTGRLGFELFDKPNWVGSEFDEHVNYQRALEGELEHTIASLEIVRSARVHLVLPEQSLFTAEAKPAKASVVLKLRRTSITSAESESIRNLVAGAVSGLAPNDVALIDADGRLNLMAPSPNAAEGDAEQALETKLVTLLEPLAGRDNVRATVNISFDHGSVERTDEVYDPTQVATLNMQRSEQTSNGSSKPAGVPGTASNTPAASPNGAVQGSAAATPGSPPLLSKDNLSVYPQAGGQSQTIKEESGTYANTKHTLHSEDGPGRVDRITAAIIVNDRMSMEGNGKLRHAVWKPRTVDEMHRMEELVQASIGFDSKRGDQVVVQNLSFIGNSPGESPTAIAKAADQVRDLLRAEPGLLRTLALGVCGVLLVLYVLRPVSRQIIATLHQPVAYSLGQHGMDSFGADMRSLHDGAPNELHMPEALALKKGKSSAQVIFEEVSEHIRREPMQSTRLLENWISTPDHPDAE